jgi:hypothetical protein
MNKVTAWPRPAADFGGHAEKFPSDVDRAVQSATQLIQSQVLQVEAVSKEKSAAIEGTFASNALALTAALAAQEGGSLYVRRYTHSLRRSGLAAGGGSAGR